MCTESFIALAIYAKTLFKILRNRIIPCYITGMKRRNYQSITDLGPYVKREVRGHLVKGNVYDHHNDKKSYFKQTLEYSMWF